MGKGSETLLRVVVVRENDRIVPALVREQKLTAYGLPNILLRVFHHPNPHTLCLNQHPNFRRRLS
jgi:hypothetical protein